MHNPNNAVHAHSTMKQLAACWSAVRAGAMTRHGCFHAVCRLPDCSDHGVLHQSLNPLETGRYDMTMQVWMNINRQARGSVVLTPHKVSNTCKSVQHMQYT